MLPRVEYVKTRVYNKKIDNLDCLLQVHYYSAKQEESIQPPSIRGFPRPR